MLIPLLFPLSTKSRPFSFLVQIPPLTLLHGLRPFVLASSLTLFFPKTFFYLQNLLGTNFLSVFLFSSFFIFFISFFFSFCFPFPHIGEHLIIFTSPFSQSISGLWAANHGIPNITSVFPRLHMFILTLSTCFLKNMLHSTYCIIAPPTFLTRSGFLSFSILNPFSLTKAVSMNRPVVSLSNNTFTTTPLWFSSFFSPTFIHTFFSSCSICCTSLTLSVVLEKFNLLPNFSGCNILYKLLEASWELTVLHFLLPTLAAYPLLLFYFSSNNFRSYGSTFHNDNMSYLLLSLCWHPSHLGLSVDLINFPLYWLYLLYSYILLHCLSISVLSVLPSLHIIPPNSPLGCIFLLRHTTFFPNILSSALFCL